MARQLESGRRDRPDSPLLPTFVQTPIWRRPRDAAGGTRGDAEGTGAGSGAEDADFGGDGDLAGGHGPPAGLRITTAATAAAATTAAVAAIVLLPAVGHLTLRRPCRAPAPAAPRATRANARDAEPTPRPRPPLAATAPTARLSPPPPPQAGWRA